MKNLIKIIFPEPFKKILRKIENFFYRIKFGFKNPIIIDGVLGMKYILYPDNKWPIRWTIEGGAYKKEYSAINNLVKTGDIVLDIGSHVGMIAIYLGKIVGEKGKIHCFEPFPNSFNRLNYNIYLNNFNNVILNNVAMSDKVGTADFYYQPDDFQLNSLGQVSDGIEKLNNKIQVETNTIDNYSEKNNINRINFLKIDTEGYEYNVLLGAEKMLSNGNIDTIQFEISKVPLESLGRNPAEIINFLHKKNYKVFEYNENQMKFNEIDTIIAGYDNFYASRKNLNDK